MTKLAEVNSKFDWIPEQVWDRQTVRMKGRMNARNRIGEGQSEERKTDSRWNESRAIDSRNGSCKMGEFTLFVLLKYDERVEK